MTVSVRPALVSDRSHLRSLLDEYLNELSGFGEVDRSYPWFEAYWQPEEARWPYLIEDASRAALGFALVNAHAPEGVSAQFAMAEFFIVPSARRQGTGQEAAAAIFRHHPGIWAVAIMGGNARALRFWPLAIAAAGAGDIEKAVVHDDVAYRFRIRAVL